MQGAAPLQFLRLLQRRPNAKMGSVGTATSVVLQQHSMTINGAELPPATTVFDVVNPSTGASFAVAPHASQADADAAVAAAKATFPGWAATPLAERKAVMMRAHGALAAHSQELLEREIPDISKDLEIASGRLLADQRLRASA